MKLNALATSRRSVLRLGAVGVAVLLPMTPRPAAAAGGRAPECLLDVEPHNG